VLGDNRNDSEDSRYWGFVPASDLVGRPLLVYFTLPQPYLNSPPPPLRERLHRAFDVHILR
jgi:signal peptidase I